MEVKICQTCKGEGKYRVDIPSHNNDYKMENCTNCNRTGKVIVAEIHLTAEVPYTEGSDGLLFWDTNVHETSRKLKKIRNLT